MDLTNLDDFKGLLSRYNVRPSDRLGQNFLIDRLVLDSIVAAADLKATDVVLEIGAGAGTLTTALAEKCRRVIAVEKDRKLIKPLKTALREFSNVTIINDDILKVDLPEVLDSEIENWKLKIGNYSFKVVANIPYYLTGEILRQLLQASVRPALIVLLVQKEVGERVTALPGQMSILGISVQLYGRPELVRVVPAGAFWPKPRVDSAIIKITPHAKPPLAISEKEFFRLVKIGFSAKRKTLLNNFSSGWQLTKERVVKILNQADVAPSRRAQELSLEEWGRIYKVFTEIFPISR